MKYVKKQEMKVKNLLDAKIIVPLRYSDWVANLVPVRKKNGEIRLCVDFRNLNKTFDGHLSCVDRSPVFLLVDFV